MTLVLKRYGRQVYIPLVFLDETYAPSFLYCYFCPQNLVPISTPSFPKIHQLHVQLNLKKYQCPNINIGLFKEYWSECDKQSMKKNVLLSPCATFAQSMDIMISEFGRHNITVGRLDSWQKEDDSNLRASYLSVVSASMESSEEVQEELIEEGTGFVFFPHYAFHVWYCREGSNFLAADWGILLIPFDPWVWLSIYLTILLASAIAASLDKKKLRIDMLILTQFRVLMSIISPMVEAVSGNTTVKKMLAATSLGFVILVNLYSGVVTSYTTVVPEIEGFSKLYDLLTSG